MTVEQLRHPFFVTKSTRRKRLLALDAIWTMFFFLLVAILSTSSVQAQLVINIKNAGGEVFQEKITSNVTEDIIELEYRNTDGSVITQLIDFKHEVEINRIILLGEPERGDQQRFQTFCFVTLLNSDDFISTDAMSKLRQKHPGTIRQPEEDKGQDLYEMDLSVDLTKSSILSPHLGRLCGETGVGLGVNASQAFAREIDLKAWTNSEAVNRDVLLLTSSVWKVSSTASQSSSSLAPKPVSCNLLAAAQENDETGNELRDSRSDHLKPCQCQLQICIPWYPCALKYCRGKDESSGKSISYRCGIRTCKKCRIFLFQAKRKANCFWED